MPLPFDELVVWYAGDDGSA